ncbi:hypothetical protein FRB95_004793 [Tulasnella sp. JGI-2019a]|nr:hypothetical protein FRB95_004793 [Tulasnella sp. JGI-2019a]
MSDPQTSNSSAGAGGYSNSTPSQITPHDQPLVPNNQIPNTSQDTPHNQSPTSDPQPDNAPAGDSGIYDISKVFFNDIKAYTTSKASQLRGEYLKQLAAKFCHNNNIESDEIIISQEHRGGKDPNEPNHITLKAKTPGGKFFRWVFKGRRTKCWHVPVPPAS